ncbi:hypothetical protein OG21DRAFT_800391 [Imleria badia]|nr:hypothetical protein OG21DRAFT_800391 [Imleria badia]
MPGIREHDDGVTPTRAAFERSSLGSLTDIPHTPSSTASSASLPFPVTPESGAEIPQLQPVYNQDKVLPPLPTGVRGKYPSTLSLRSQSGRLQRPRTYSNASSVSNSSMLGVPSGEAKPISASPSSTPRQSLAERPTKTSIPASSPRPSLNGTPRPSLTIPKSPLPPQSATSGLPRPTTPSSPYANAGQGYTPRPLRLTELNQPPGKALEPGEQSPRLGQGPIWRRHRRSHQEVRRYCLYHRRGLVPVRIQPYRRPSPLARSLLCQVQVRARASVQGPGRERV